MEQSRVLSLLIISRVLMTLMFDSGLILYGEIRCQSFFGVKGLNTNIKTVFVTKKEKLQASVIHP